MDRCPTFNLTQSKNNEAIEVINRNKPRNEKSEYPINSRLPLTENATNSHPLMNSPGSSMTPDYPDLIPEQAKNKHKESKFYPQAHSTALENSTEFCETFDRHLNQPILEYDEKLPGKKTYLIYNV